MGTTHSLKLRGRRNGRGAIRKSDLSSGRRWLVEAMQELAFGRMKHLILVRGEPVVDLPPRVYRDHRLTGPNQQRTETHLADFLLKDQVIVMLEEFDRIGSGVIAVLEVRDGLPYAMTLEERPGR